MCMHRLPRNKVITASWLKRCDVPPETTTLFRAYFPRGVEYTHVGLKSLFTQMPAADDIVKVLGGSTNAHLAFKEARTERAWKYCHSVRGMFDRLRCGEITQEEYDTTMMYAQQSFLNDVSSLACGFVGFRNTKGTTK
jgi:hypothetical protein